MRKKVVCLASVVLAVGAAAGGVYYYRYIYKGGNGGSAGAEGSVYVECVTDIMTQGYTGLQDRFVGVVEPQESKDIQLDSDKKLGEVFVSQGDTVTPGTPLFCYDVEEMELKLKEADLELEEMNNTLETLKQQLTQLQLQAAKAKPADQQTIALEILSTENAIHKQEYSISAKQLERSQLEKNLDNSIVEADMTGIVKSINLNAGGQEYSDYGDSSNAFMTILATGDYRVKAKCNEMNISSLYVDQEMIIYPRSDETKHYKGVVERIDTEPIKENTNQYYYSEGSGESASKYQFYVKFTDVMDLMLGQHVVLMPDLGFEEKDGLWIPQYYVVEDINETYVWSCDENNRMEKRPVTIASVDDTGREYQIGSGLTEKDYIAFPDDMIEEGMEAVLPENMLQ